MTEGNGNGGVEGGCQEQPGLKVERQCKVGNLCASSELDMDFVTMVTSNNKRRESSN